MKPILKNVLLLAAALPSFAAHAAEIDNPDDCPRPVEADGLSMCLFDGGTDPWLDQAWDQTGPNTWTNPEDGTQSTWNETAPNDYEIVDTNLAAQGGAVVPVPPPPAPPVPPPPPPPDAPLPVLPTDPPLGLTVGDYTFGEGGWTGSATGREGPFGVTRLIGMPPTEAQYAELEFAWAVHKANTTRPYRHVGILVSEIETEVIPTPPPPAQQGDAWYGIDYALLRKALRERDAAERAAAGEEEEAPPTYTDCAPECGPLWDGVVVIKEVVEDAGGFVFGDIWPPESGVTYEWLEDTLAGVLERLGEYDYEDFVDSYMSHVAKPAYECTAQECVEIGGGGFGYDLGRAMMWFRDLVDPRDGTLLTEGEALYLETVEPFMRELLVDALGMVARGELTIEQAASAVFALGMRYHGALVEPALLPGQVHVSELGGLRPVTGALYVTLR